VPLGKLLSLNSSSHKYEILDPNYAKISVNIAVASCVHIFEPQWNPMIEAQAVARVIRLGQRKKVSIIRYIVKGTVEQASRMQPSVGRHLTN